MCDINLLDLAVLRDELNSGVGKRNQEEIIKRMKKICNFFIAKKKNKIFN